MEVDLLSEELQPLWQQRLAAEAAELAAQPAGRLWLQPVTQLDISATRIRDLVAAGKSPRFLLPDAVWNLIRMHGLYRAPDDELTTELKT
jgi:nicotinate-nucleotide adenylyltransferase